MRGPEAQSRNSSSNGGECRRAEGRGSPDSALTATFWVMSNNVSRSAGFILPLTIKVFLQRNRGGT